MEALLVKLLLGVFLIPCVFAGPHIFEINSAHGNLTRLYGGDMVISTSKLGKAARGGVCAACGRWQKPEHDLDNYHVPYVFDDRYQPAEHSRFQWVWGYMESVFNIKFVQRTTENDYIMIGPYGGCWSYVGREGDEQELSIDADCLWVGLIAHEFLHALGLGHEHQRPEQEQFLDIHWENIRSEFLDQLKPLDDYLLAGEYTPYDMASIMHYGRNSFAVAGKLSFDAKDTSYNILVDGSRIEMSSCDMTDINLIYPGVKKPPKCAPHTLYDNVEPTQFAHDHLDKDTVESWCRFNNELYFVENASAICQLKGGAKFPPPPADLYAPDPTTSLPTTAATTKATTTETTKAPTEEPTTTESRRTRVCRVVDQKR